MDNLNYTELSVKDDKEMIKSPESLEEFQSDKQWVYFCFEYKTYTCSSIYNCSENGTRSFYTRTELNWPASWSSSFSSFLGLQ